MTVEEVALKEFRLLAKCARDKMRTAKMMRAERDSDARWFFTMAREHRIQMRTLARIIRAIRAEREERGDMVGAFGQGIRTAYEAGRRDALRGVQGACLFEKGERLLIAEEAEDRSVLTDDPAEWRLAESMRTFASVCEYIAETAEEAAR